MEVRYGPEKEVDDLAYLQVFNGLSRRYWNRRKQTNKQKQIKKSISSWANWRRPGDYNNWIELHFHNLFPHCEEKNRNAQIIANIIYLWSYPNQEELKWSSHRWIQATTITTTKFYYCYCELMFTLCRHSLVNFTRSY